VVSDRPLNLVTNDDGILSLACLTPFRFTTTRTKHRSIRVTDADTVQVDRSVPGVLIATLNRPKRMNALTFAMFAQLQTLCDNVTADDTVRTIILTGAGRGFCAGLDLEDAATLPAMSAAQFLHEQEGWANAITSFRRLPKPVIAAVNGAAAGAGFSLALAADIRLATPAARFNAAFVKIGLTGGDCGSSWTLPRIVGLGHANEILLTGRLVDADEAARIGLVNRIVAPDDLLREAITLAQTINANSPLGVRLTKQVVQTNIDAPSLEAAVAIENRNQALASRSPDMAEALTAFREKRPPSFTGS
jgi:enoyl-CoA hydratase/carnithine racemase